VLANWDRLTRFVDDPADPARQQRDRAASEVQLSEDGITRIENGDNLVFAQYGEADIPNYWQYARTFTHIVVVVKENHTVTPSTTLS
jgi:hypothetical protein